MLYKLLKKDCAWSLVPMKAAPTLICCLNHCSDKKIPESWFSDQKYDPDAGDTPFDIYVDENGTVSDPKKLRTGSSESLDKPKQTSLETTEGTAETPVDRAAGF